MEDKGKDAYEDNVEEYVAEAGDEHGDMLGVCMGMLGWGKEGTVLLSIPTSSAGVSGGVASPANIARIHDVGLVRFGALGMSLVLGLRWQRCRIGRMTLLVNCFGRRSRVTYDDDN